MASSALPLMYGSLVFCRVYQSRLHKIFIVRSRPRPSIISLQLYLGSEILAVEFRTFWHYRWLDALSFSTFFKDTLREAREGWTEGGSSKWIGNASDGHQCIILSCFNLRPIREPGEFMICGKEGHPQELTGHDSLRIAAPTRLRWVNAFK